MYYNYYVHILQSQYCLHLVELEHAENRTQRHMFFGLLCQISISFFLSFIKCPLNTNIALLIGYNMEDYVNVHTVRTCSLLSACCHQVLTLFFFLLEMLLHF